MTTIAVQQAVAVQDVPLADMNTTPLIDVMLVLLIMFIITLPIQTHSVSIDLPVGGMAIDSLQNRITIDQSGTAYWNGQLATQPQLMQLLQRAHQLQPEPSLLLEPAAAAPYVIVDQTLAVIRRSGTGNLAFVGNERYAREF